MKRFRLPSSNSLFSGFVLFMSVVLCLACSSVFGHEWMINGTNLEAKAVDFDGTKVLLEDGQGNRQAVPMNELNAKDLQYLTNLLSIRNAGIQQQLEQQQIRQQQVQLMSQFVDIWTIRMVAPNGHSGSRNYFAANSLQAKQLAWQEFPNARILSAQKLPRRGQIGVVGNANGFGVRPVVNFIPTATFFNSRN